MGGTRWVMVSIRLAVCVAGAAYLWRSGLRPHSDEPQGKVDRLIRIVGALLMTSIPLIYIAYRMGLLRSLLGPVSN